MKRQVKIPPKLLPVFLGEADIRGAYGGRGSAKTRTFAKMSAVRALMWAKAGREGIILCGRQYMNSLDESSLEEVKAAIRSEVWLEANFEIGEKYVKTRCGRVAYKFTGLDRNVDSIKSKARILLCWVDEAEPVTEEAWQKLIPTLREVDSELWVTWNPERKKSATHRRFRENSDPRMKVVEMNWRDNPWFPAILDRVRLKDQAERPEHYDHIWEGGFATVATGAYFASVLLKAKQDGRIGRVAADPLLPVRAYFDLGGSGANADAMAIWLVQFVGQEIRVLDYIEGRSQVLAYYVSELRKRGYDDSLVIRLPHDGVNENNITGKRYEQHLRDAGFTNVSVIKNQGKGAAMMRVEAVRRIFGKCWFNEATTESGRAALGWYHEKQDEKRDVGHGPEHDWSSHGADAFGLMAIDYEEPSRSAGFGRKIEYAPLGIA